MIILLYYLLCVVIVEGVHEKRILLGDPDVIESRLGSLENQLKQQVQQIQTLSQQIQTLTQENQNQIQYTQQQAQKILSLTSENLQLKQAIQSSEESIVKINTTHQADKTALHSLVASLTKSTAAVAQGSTYTRWGRTDCPSAELVYSGYTAGQRYYFNSIYYSGPANTLCLPRDPDMSNISNSNEWSPLFGTEYETNVFDHDSSNNDMPCAVCRNGNTSSSIMIPGRRSCYPGWTNEYRGILASGHINHKPSSYICVDANPEYLVSGERDEDGHLFYPVITKCGPLPCPPYHNNLLVDCVVCSK